jgi:dTDP-4-dehydrorhamnose reductase
LRVLLTGADGQVGRALAKSRPAAVELIAMTRAELDICDARRVAEEMRARRPDLVINAAAFTAVDRAETERDAAENANAVGPRVLADAVAAIDGRLFHLSTDYVFNGESSTPYDPEDRPDPLNEYGRSKLRGDIAVASVLPERSIVLRTTWVYSATGRNFVRTMLGLMKQRDSVRVVADQIGTPTAAQSIAEVLWRFAERSTARGVYHWTDAGIASWYDFAVAIAEEAAALGELKSEINVIPITTSEYPTPARRPRFSLLDCRKTVEDAGIAQVHWRVWLRRIMRELQIA